jgi:dolichyl-phosphate beta-glucosyltransferase
LPNLSQPYLAVIIPAYNEEQRILPTLERIREYLTVQTYTWSVTLISDGSKDNTVAIAEEFARANPGFHVLAYKPNRGKGYAVRKGMSEVDGDLILFSDADLAAPIEEVEKLLDHIKAGAEVAIGSRPLKESKLEVHQSKFRELMGRSFNVAVQLLAVRGIHDTQCGFKIFVNKAACDVFSRCKLDGFGFDFESLMIARDLGYRIDEVPIRWSHQEGSKVVLMRDGPKMLWDLVKLRFRGKRNRLKKKDAG